MDKSHYDFYMVGSEVNYFPAKPQIVMKNKEDYFSIKY